MQESTMGKGLTGSSISLNKLAQGHYMSNESTPECGDREKDIKLKLKHILTNCPSLKNRKRHLFDTIKKTRKQILTNGITSCSGTLFMFATSIDFLKKNSKFPMKIY